MADETDSTGDDEPSTGNQIDAPTASESPGPVPTLGRRSLLGTMAAAGLVPPVSGVGSADRQSVETGSELLHAELIDSESNERRVFDSRADIDQSSLPPGEYTLRERSRHGGGIRERRERFRVPETQVTTAETGIEPRVLVPERGPLLSPYTTDDELTILAGAVDTSEDGSPSPASDVSLTIEISGPGFGGDIVETIETTTGPDGNVRETVDLTEFEHGSYDADVFLSEEDGGVDTDRFYVGAVSELFTGTDQAPLSESVDLALSSLTGGEVEDGVTRPVTVEGPDEQDTVEVAIEDGIGQFSYSFDQPGEYSLSTDTADGFSTTLFAREFTALPSQLFTEVYVDEGGVFGGVLFDSDGLAAQQTVTLRLIESFEDEVYFEATTMTDEFGTFSFDIDVTEADIFPTVEILVDDTIALQTLPRITDSPYDRDDPVPLDFSASFAEFVVGPGETVDLDISFTAEGEPVADADVSLLYEYETLDGIPVDSQTVTTDENGEATVPVSVPEDAPDGARFAVDARTTLEDTPIQAGTSVRIQQIETALDNQFDLALGETTTIDFTATERATDLPANGIPIPTFAVNRQLNAGVFAAETVVTDSNGQASVDVTTPADAVDQVAFRPIEPSQQSTTTYSSTIRPFSVTINSDDETVRPGETVSVSYQTDFDGDTRAVIFLRVRETGFSAVDTAVAREGEPARLTVPPWSGPGSNLDVEVLAVSDGGEVSREFALIAETADTLVAQFGFEPTAPAPGEEITLFDSSVTPADEIVDRQWTVDGTVRNEADAEITAVFEASGEYDVTLSVTDNAGETDELTRTITVTGEDILVASFDVTPQAPTVGEEATFLDTSSPGEVSTVSREWDLTGDGTVDATGEEAATATKSLAPSK